MAPRSKKLKVMELVEARTTSSNHESPGPENDANTKEKQSRHRGKTVMANVWTSTEKIVIQVDKYGVPCTKDAAVLSSFLGVLAKNGAYAPINIPNWRHEDFTPYKAKCLKLLMTKFDFPRTQETVTWILKNLNKRWRDWKGDLKAEFYVPKAKEQVVLEPPSTVLEEQWSGLVRQWYNPKNEEIAEINKRNAKKQNNAHTCGRKSFARIRIEIETETGKEPDRLTMWDATHKKKDGSYVNEEFRKKLETAHDLQISYTNSNANSEQSEINEIIFQKIYGAEHNGRVRGLGLGPTPSRYFSVMSKFTSTSASSTESNHKAELENVKLELAEMKDKYAKLCADMADMKELFGGFMAERNFNDRMSKVPTEEVEDVASVE